jgi:RND family efflux transporter MFP subunit
MSRLPIRILKVLLPLVVVAGAGLAAYAMFLSRPPVEIQTPVIDPPSVRVQRVTFDAVTLTVSSQGTVQPRTSSQLVPEISGPVIEIAPSFAVGGFFEAGDVLLRIDPYDYQQAVIAGRSELAQAELRLAQEEAEAEVARREWQDLGRGDASRLTLRQPQMEDARASVAAAEAALDRATRDLERADITAPYAGRVLSKDVDVGQFVNKGNTVARIYAIDSAEIRLPLPDAELAYVDVPLSYRGTSRQSGPRVTISSNFAGREHTWQGRIVRTEGEIDPVSRMVHLIAEVRDPYAPGNDPLRPPLSAGMFVEAEIAGRTINDVVVLPWAALRGRNQVLIVDDDSRLRFRDVEILRSTSAEVMVRAGLAEGEAVCVSPLDTVTDGMLVRVVDDDLRMAGRVPAPASPPAAVEPPSPRAAVPDLPPVTTETVAEPATAAFDVDSTQSRDDQLAAIRREIARLTGAAASASASAPQPTATSPEPQRDRATAGRPGPRGGRGRGDNPRGNRGPGRGATSRGGDDGRGARGGAPGASAPEVPAPRRTEPAPVPEPDTPAGATAPAGPQVAMLPFSNLSRDPNDGEIGGSLTTALRAALMDGDTGGVVPLTSTDNAAGLEDAKARNATWLVTGGFQRVGDQLRVTARVVDVAGGDVIGSVKVDGTLANLDELASQMIAGVRANLPSGTPGAPSAPNRSPVDSVATTARPATRGVAIGPFANISRNPADDGLGRDLADALAGGLKQLPDLSVISLGAVSDATAMDAAAARNATWLLGGGYQRVGEQLRITARLTDVATGELVHIVKTDGRVDELPALLAEVVSALQAVIDADAARVSPTHDEVLA